MELIRINRCISDAGSVSRRGADRLIEAGLVEILFAQDGCRRKAVPGDKVGPGDTVFLKGVPLERNAPKAYLLYHKPQGVVCTMRRDIRGNLPSAVSYKGPFSYVGRLDKDSTGLILLTNDGELNNRLSRAAMQHEKEYICTVDKPLTDHFLTSMRSGVPILGTLTRPCKVFRINDRSFRIILTQGLNRQIRRMCGALGYRVTKLHRIRIENLRLGDLPEGRWRYLTDEELKTLQKICGMENDG